MIEFVLLVNKQGQTRLSRYFVDKTRQERSALESEVVRTCLSRKDRQCSFFDWRDVKVVYRRYASLFFLVGSRNPTSREEDADNEIALLELIQCFVESLDAFFTSVCELDIMYNLEKAHFILDEMVQNGRIVETNKKNVLATVKQLDVRDKTLKSK
ncbi:MAG: hypothetical protein MHM6MM_004911 [Cercozoa sp. M6MM]